MNEQSRRVLFYGSVPVPYAAACAEDTFFIGRCPYAARLAIMQPSTRGEGSPRFGKPHSCRQREVIALGLFDLCARPLKNKTRVSLSHARVRSTGAEGPCVMQVEPLLHRECALESMKHCPSLKRDIAAGTLMIRQVHRTRVQFALMDAEYVASITGESQIAVGHAKVELIDWIDRDADWLAR